jgi:hypothetical protein
MRCGAFWPPNLLTILREITGSPLFVLNEENHLILHFLSSRPFELSGSDQVWEIAALSTVHQGASGVGESGV